MDDPTNADDPRPVRRASQPDDLDSGAGVRCVHHAPPADVDAHVSESWEEEQVARHHSGSGDASGLVVERIRTVWEFNAQAPIRPVDESGAVEAAGGRGPSPSIGHPDLSDGDRGRAFADGRLGNHGERRSVPSRSLSRDGRGCILLWECVGTAEDERGKSERQQRAAEGGRHGGKRTTGCISGDGAALGLFLSVGS